MASRVVVPDTKRLEISQGDWLLVKKRLNAGEGRRIQKRLVPHAKMGEKLEVDLEQIGKSMAVEYLLDWSLTDPRGNPLVIRDASPDAKAAALDSLDIESFKEIIDAIDAHETEMDAERDAEKNAQGGGNVSLATSTSAA